MCLFWLKPNPEFLRNDYDFLRKLGFGTRHRSCSQLTKSKKAIELQKSETLSYQMADNAQNHYKIGDSSCVERESRPHFVQEFRNLPAPGHMQSKYNWCDTARTDSLDPQPPFVPSRTCSELPSNIAPRLFRDHDPVVEWSITSQAAMIFTK